MSDLAYKLLDREEWRAARARGAYHGSAVDRADGFIHLSAAGQLAETARRHYAGRDGLVLLTIDLARVDGVRWEASRGGALFPHIHGALPVSAATAERPLAVDADGTMRFEDGGPTWAE
jgi:uncharacterized protein (DUF952 family)